MIHKSSIVAIGKVLSVSMLNQVVSSGTTFFLGIYLVQVLTLEEFGLYGIGFSISLLYSGVGNALFLTQMVVHIPDKSPLDKIHYSARMLVMLTLFCFLSFLLLLCIVLFGEFYWYTLREYSEFIFSIMAAAIANLMKDYFIRYSYIIQKESRALITSLCWSIAIILLLTLMHFLDFKLTAVVVLWIFSLSNFIAVLISFFINKLPVLKIRKDLMLEDFHEAFTGGRWALGGVSVTWLQTQAYVYISAALLGSAGVALANAARVFISPFNFLLPAINQIALPRFAELRNKNRSRLIRIVYLYTLSLSLAGILYVLLLLIVVEKIIPLVLGNKYTIEEIKPLIYVWCAALLFQLIRSGSSSLLQVLKAFKVLMMDNLISAFITIVMTYFLATQFGVLGAIVGISIGEFILAILLWNRIRNEK